MDRNFVYPGETPLDTDFLSIEKNAMLGLGAMLEMLVGQQSVVAGFTCTPLANTVITGEAFAVSISRGFATSYQEVDPNSFGSLGTDTRNIMKCGINLSATQIPLTNAAPATTGQAVDYLISAAFSEVDESETILPYVNAANPAQPWTGPSNSGTAQNTVRAQTVIFQVTAGTPAAAGSQAVPATPGGYVPMFVVTVNHGDTGTISGQIVKSATAPFFQAFSTTSTTSTFPVITTNAINTNTSFSTTGPGFINTTMYYYGTLPTNTEYSGINFSSSTSVNGGNFNLLNSTLALASGWGGLHQAVQGQINVDAAPTFLGADNNVYSGVGLQGSCFVSTAFGSVYAPIGGFFGGSSYINQTNSTGYTLGTFSWEFDICVAGGSQTQRKNGMNIVQISGDSARGTIEDSAISINNQGGALTSWVVGLEFGSPSQGWAFGTDSTLIGSPIREFGATPSISYNTALYCIDLRAINITSGGNSFIAPGVAIDPAGNASAQSITVKGAVNAGTTVLSSVTVQAGGTFLSIPTLGVQAPPGSGTPATATVATMAAVAGPDISIGGGGTGWTTGNVVTLAGGTGTAPTFTVTASGGVVTSLTMLTPGSMSALPAMPATLTGAGSGLSATIGFGIATVSVTPGSGYLPGVPPIIFTSTPDYYPAKLRAVMAATTAGILALNAAGGDVQAGTGSALATNATTGFFKFPFMAGAPVSAPANSNGAALVLNTSTHTLNIYDPTAGAWYHLALTSGAG